MVNRRVESGHALVLALFLITLVAMSVQALHATLSERHRAVEREAETATVQALADAALAATLAHLSAEPAFGGVPRQLLGEGTITSRVRPAGAGRLEVQVEARLGERRAMLSATVELTASGPRVLSWRRGQ